MSQLPLRALGLALSLVLTPACTLVAIDSQSGPPGVRADGLIEGHVAFGIRDEDQVLHLDLFDGSSDGAIGELVLWKLARLEVGLAGVALGLGPVDLAIGTLFYDPRMPRFLSDDGPKKHGHHAHAHDEDDHDDHDGDDD